MAIKGLDNLLAKWKNGEYEGIDAFESDLNKALATDWIPKTAFNELNEKHKLADSQLKETAAQLDTLKSKAGLSDEYKAQIEKMASDHAKAKSDFESQIKTMKNDWALTTELSKAKARDAKLVKSVIDTSKLTFNEDGTIAGLDEQLKTARETYSYLFDSDAFPNESAQVIQPPKFGNSQLPSKTGDSILDAMRASAGV